MKHKIELTFDSIPENEAFARIVVSAFLIRINPTLSLVSEVRTAVSEAVTNAVVHAYRTKVGLIKLSAELSDEEVRIVIEDHGCGIPDIRQAMEPFFTSQPDEERAGIGFALMQSFMDELDVQSKVNAGTRVMMRKRFDIGA